MWTNALHCKAVCWGASPYFRRINIGRFPSLEIEKFVGFTKCPFHVFDRYEIHIEDLRDFIYAHFIIFRSSSSQNMIQISQLTFEKQYDTHLATHIWKTTKKVPRTFNKSFFRISRFSDMKTECVARMLP